jgi:hypothetical protein
MEEKRRFSRFACNENIIVQLSERRIEARILNISLKGALVVFDDDVSIQEGDKCKIKLKVTHPDTIISLTFASLVSHVRKNQVGVMFARMDIDTLIHLRNYLEARTANPQLVFDEFDHLMASSTPKD